MPGALYLVGESPRPLALRNIVSQRIELFYEHGGYSADVLLLKWPVVHRED